MTGLPPYDVEATRDQVLAAMVTQIEQGEMQVWIKLATQRSKPGS
jgi:hypothetical protein